MIKKEITPSNGTLTSCEKISYFPNFILNENIKTLELIKNTIAPFDEWRKEMNNLLLHNDADSRKKYFEIYFKFEEADGHHIEEKILNEALKIGLNNKILNKNFNSLTQGEKALAMIISCFLKKESLPLLNNPSEYLTINQRNSLANYLSLIDKGFILSSEDKILLDSCVNYIVSLEEKDAKISRGNYTVWKLQTKLEENFQNYSMQPQFIPQFIK